MVRPQLLDFSGGQLEAVAVRAIAAHLERCPGCRRVLAREVRMATLLEALPSVSPASDAWSSVALRLRDADPASRRLRCSPRPMAWAGSLIAVSAVALTLLTPAPRPMAPLPEPDMLRGLAPAAAAGLSPERAADPLLTVQHRLDLLLDGVAERGS